MKRLLYSFVILLLAIIVACQPPSHSALSLLTTDSLMNMQPDSACWALEQLYPLLSELSPQESALFTLQQLNTFYRNNQVLSPHKEKLDEILTFFKKKKDNVNIGKVYLLKGRMELEEKHAEQSIIYFQDAIAELSKKENGLFLAMAYSDLGEVYMQQDLYDESMECHLKSRDIYQLVNDMKGYSIETNLLAYLYLFKGEVSTAVGIYDKILSQVEQMGDTLLWAFVLNNAGIADEQNGDYEEALNKLRLSVQLAMHCGKEPNYQSLAQVFYQVGARDSAYKYLIMAVSSTKLETRAAAYTLLSDLRKEEGDLKGALEYATCYELCKDSIFSTTHALEVMRMNYKHKFDTILQQFQRDFFYKIIFVSVAFVLILLLGASLFRNWGKRKQNAMLQYQKQLSKLENNIAVLSSEKLKLQQELTLLCQSQSTENNDDNNIACLLVESKEEKLNKLESEVLELRIELFKSTHIGQRIIEEDMRSKQKGEVNLLKTAERCEMIENLTNIFRDTINFLMADIPELTKEDCYFCCLSLLGLSTHTIAACFGYSDGQVIRQRRYRIKQKLEHHDCSFYLYSRIFSR